MGRDSTACSHSFSPLRNFAVNKNVLIGYEMVFCKYTEVIFVIFRYHKIAVPFWLNPVKKCEDKDKIVLFHIVSLMIFRWVV